MRHYLLIGTRHLQNPIIMKKKKTFTSRLKRIESKCDRMTVLLDNLNRLVRGEVVDSLIDTMRQEALRLRELSREERERTDGLRG